MRFLNANSALKLLLGFIVGAAYYRFIWIDQVDPYKCKALLNNGSWLDEVPRIWQPSGCLLHDYKKKDITECLHNRRIVLIGDSTVRQIYWALARKIGIIQASNEINTEMQDGYKHKDMSIIHQGVSVHFIWDPFLNTSSLRKELVQFALVSPHHNIPFGTLKDAIGSIYSSADFSELVYSNESASLILVGNPGLWYARYGSENYFSEYKEAIDRVINSGDKTIQGPYMSPLLVPHLPKPVSTNCLLFAPIQTPEYSLLSTGRASTITSDKIRRMQDYLYVSSKKHSRMIPWAYLGMTASTPQAYKADGLHVVDTVADRKADILLNARCNAEFTAKHRYDRTCCMAYPPTGKVHLVMTAILLAVLLTSNIGKSPWSMTRCPAANALLVVAGAVHACYQADRTQIFSKSNKSFHSPLYLACCFAVIFLGVVSLNKTWRWQARAPSSPAIGHEKAQRHATHELPDCQPELVLLSRGQTEEWKGWMQAVILLYHYMGGSENLMLYRTIRVLVASYLFMTGYGHTKFLLKKQEYSSWRVARVLVRLNLLSCVLPYIMRTSYMTYYFAPLVSFWFVVVHATMAINHRRNNDGVFLLVKFIISAALTTSIIKFPGILEGCFYGLKAICGISWDVYEFRFRVSLDMYIVYVGMLFAVLQQRSEERHAKVEFKRFNLTGTLAFIVCIFVFFYPTFHSMGSLTTKEFSNTWHPYTSIFPILLFVNLRNCSSFSRRYHSSLLAWLGRISLETYILQSHIWLAGDAHGVLRIGIWHSWLDFALLTPAFIWISWNVASATQVLTEWIVPPQRDEDYQLTRRTTRNWSHKVVREVLFDFRCRVGLILLGMRLLNLAYD